jgi:hypothetical protein
MRLVVSIASILLTAAPALAATITLGPQKPDRPNVVMVEGLLVADDEDQFGDKTASLPSAIVAFSSDGGSLVAGLRIGEAIRRKGFSTIVPDGRRCAAACALAWLGGVERFIGTDGRIGFHAAYDSASEGDTGIGKTVVGAYLAKMGLPYEAVIYITQAAPNEMTWLNMSDAAHRGIRVTLLSSLASTVNIRSPEPEATLPKKECAAILNMVVKCVRLPECKEGRIFDNFAMAAQRYFNRLEEMTVFTSRNFYGVCTTVCTSKSYVAKQARSILCGY